MTLATSRRVLVVDDNADTVVLLRDCLRKLGFDAVGFESGPECLRWLEATTADVVIADVDMPEMSGLVLLAGLRQAYPRMPVVILGDPRAPESNLEARRLGAYDVLDKPVSVLALADVLDRLLS